MIIYKVPTNYHKGIMEFEVKNINNDGTFNYINPCWADKISIKPFIPKDGYNQPTFFLNYEEAKIFIIDRIKNKIADYEARIKKCHATLNNI